jgi:Protein of unknown function (DUF3800)
MDLILVDDSKQAKPTRPGMGPLVGAGGLHVPSTSIRSLAGALDEICLGHGFPTPQDEFKWSPKRKSWMRKNLNEGKRYEFFAACLDAAQSHGAQACVVIADTTHKTTDGKRQGHELDVVKLFLERSHNHLGRTDTEAILLADHPSGGRPAEAAFVASCLEALRDGTPYTDLDRVALVLTGDSKSTRLLQLADLVVGCAMACVGGEATYSLPLFDGHIKPMLRSEQGRIGGVGLKIHADLRYANLYHWLLGDDYIIKSGTGHPLPTEGCLYVNAPDDPSTTKA